MSRHPRRRSWIIALFAALALTASAGAYAAADPPTDPPTGPPAKTAAKAPNIIYFLVDDMSADLLGYTDTIAGLAKGGTRFTNYIVSNSLCCPSRASMFTGEFPHTTGVLTNKGSDHGGYPVFKKHEDRTYAPALHNLGYRTGYLGKYINEYEVEKGYRVPAGWDEWHAGNGGGYSEYNYKLTRYIRDENTGKDITPSTGEYLVDVLGDRATQFLRRSREHAADKPFFLQVAPFSPHSRVKRHETEPLFPPALRDRPKDKWPKGEFPHGDCGGPDCANINVADRPAFNEPNVDDKPAWVRTKPPIRNAPGCEKDPKKGCVLTQIHNDFRNRIRMMQALDDMVAKVLRELTPQEKQNTYIIFGSDNGFHLGQHRLVRGKTTPYEHDINVPLIVRRPGATEGTIVNRQLAQNVDIYATLVDIANGDRSGPTDRDGRSLLPLINGNTPPNWRDAALVEHVRPNPNAAGAPDPDYEPLANGGAPTYNAIRTNSELLVNYNAGQNGEFEYYNMADDPHQLNSNPRAPRADALKQPLRDLAHCGQTGHPDCWTAAHLR